MRIIYDISVLGQGFYVSKARTGIFRVIENLAQELVQAQVISYFSSAQNIGGYFKCTDYLQSNEALNFIPLMRPNVGNTLLKIYRYLHKRTHGDTPPPIHISLSDKFVKHINRKLFARKILNNNDLIKADIYHSPFHPFPDPVNRMKKLKKVITVYDLIPILFPQFFEQNVTMFMEQVLKSIKDEVWVTCISHATRNDLCNNLPFLDPSKVFVTHLAASDSFYFCHDLSKIEAVKNQLGIPEGPYILSLSTLEPRKNIIQTIKCFSRLIESEVNDLSLVLVGAKGWNFDPIFNAIAAKPEIRDRILVTGYVPDQYLAPLYSGAMMFVYPSFYEGFGLPPLEAMQCGVPVITSNTSSLPEVVGDAGIMVDPEDGDALCEAILKIYNSADVRHKMSTDSLMQAKKFSWKKCAEQTIDTYKMALQH